MDIVKKNLLSILCGVVALLAIASFPLIISGYQARTQAELKKRKDTYDKLAAVASKSRHLPLPPISNDPNATAPPLTVFPGPKVIDAGMAQVKQVQDQSVKLQKLVSQMNFHPLLVANSLPDAKDPFEFQRQYALQFSTVFPSMLHSATPPTGEEIQRAQEQLAQQEYQKAPKDANGEPYGKDQLDQNIQALQAKLPEKMKLEAATKHSMYMAPETALSVYPAFVAGQGVTLNPQPQDVWLAQIGLWVQQDVIKSVAELNKDSTNVNSSPVKQIVRIVVPPDMTMYVLPTATAAAGGGSDAGPANPIPTNSDTDPFPKDYTVSPTGRACNGVFDVVHFTVELNVQATDVNRVISELERNKLLTVYATNVQAVNSAFMQQLGFYFGKNPVVTLTMQCEELFLRDWTRQWMPPYIKSYLNVQEPGQQPQPQPTDQTSASNQ